jgi:hypothetical protein
MWGMERITAAHCTGCCGEQSGNRVALNVASMKVIPKCSQVGRQEGWDNTVQGDS